MTQGGRCLSPLLFSPGAMTPPASKKKPSGKKRKQSRSPKKGRGQPWSQQSKVLLGGLFVCAFVLTVLVLLSRWRESLPVAEAPPSAPTPVLQAPPEDPTAVMRTALVRVLGEFLQANPPAGEVRTVVGHQGELLVTCTGAEGDPLWLEDLWQVLATAAPNDPPRIERASAQEVVLLWQQAPLARIVFAPASYPAAEPVKPPPVVTKGPRPAPRPVPKPVLEGAPKVAIVMDDLGMDLGTARALLAIDLPVTFAILPWNEKAPQVAELAHRAGREILIHLPMEPQGYPAIKPGPEALLIGLDDAEIRRRMTRYLERVPHAVGGNNHMGSRFTENREKMQVVMEELRGAGLFFLDSLTSGSSVAFEVARAAGVPAAQRDRFLDNVQDTGKIAAELRKLARLAKRQGYAVGICHPYPQTLAALRQEAGAFAAEGVEVVPVSRLLVR